MSDFNLWGVAYMVTFPLSFVAVNSSASPHVAGVSAIACCGVSAMWVYVLLRLRRAEKLHRAAVLAHT
jgi:hypothetical protein